MVDLFEMSDKWEQLLKYGQRLFYKKKTVLYKQGDAGNGFYYLHSGLVKISASTTTEKCRMLNIVVPGQLVGVQALDRQVHFTTAVTASNAVLYHFSHETVLEIMKAHPEMVQLLTRTVIQKMNILLHAIHIKLHAAEAQIAIMLLNLFDESKPHDISLTQQELASYTGLTRITVYKILKAWKEAGVVEIKNRSFVIKNPDALKHMIEEPS